MEEDTEYLKLPLEDRCVHKLWKARVSGYEECTKLFAKIDDEKSPEFTKFAPLMKKLVTDSNAVAQEKALDAVLAFAENAFVAGKTAGEVTAGIVAKCLSAPKRTTQDKALDVILMYCEIEKYDAVAEELIKGFSQKNPKVVCGCIKAISAALREFGSKVINIKPLVKNMGAVLEDRDKNVREEAKKMVIEMYRWVGPALKPQLTSLKPIQIQELEAEFDKMPKEKPVQTRFLRSQQELKAKIQNQDEEQEEDDEEDEADARDELDAFDLMTPVNILEKLPSDFYEMVEAKKWQDRKKAMDDLFPLTQHIRLETGDYADLIKALKKIVSKDTNVMIIALAGQCLAGIAKGIKKKFSPYSISCLETVLEKFKEKKQNVVTSLREAADAIYQSTSIEAIQETACAALGNKNPNVKAETASFLARAFCYCTPVIFTKKVLKAYVTELLKTLNESDSGVRENSAEALGTAYKVVGEKAMTPFLADIDPLKLQKVKEFSEKAEIKVKIKPVKAKPAAKPAPAPTKEPAKPVKKVSTKLQNGRPEGPSGGLQRSKKPGDSKGGGASKDMDCLNMNDNFEEDDLEEETKDNPVADNEARVNISAQITENLISEFGDKNWKVRIEALGKVSSMLNDSKFIMADIGELPTSLCARLSDTNKNIAAEALRITSQLGTALGPHCKSHVRVMIPGIFAVLGDTKKSMRDQALNTLNDWATQMNCVKDVIDGEMCVDALKSGSPFLKTELILWLSEKLKDAPPKSLNKEELNGCVGYIFAGLEDRNVDIRKASNEAILPFMLHLGYEGMTKHASKVKPVSKNTVLQALEKAKPNLPARPPSTSSGPVKSKSSGAMGSRQGSSVERGERPSSGVGSGGSSARAGGIKKGVVARVPGKPVSSSRKEEEVDSSPLLQVNSIKQQRITEEQRMRTLRWDFATPRPEFVSQLKDQMSAANVNRQLLTNMFHQDFKFHIRAIDALAEDLSVNVDACIANLDLVLRWLTIRFFDTNPSVILKAMDYLSNMFTLLSDNDFHLSDYEAYSFLPFLITKFGDPKDSIRGPTRNIIRLICNIYPASKISPYILDGLKSKNARQRAECLETLGSLIEGHGMAVCQPSPPAALKEVAKQIADRDNSVRNAALNCLLQVYYRQGEKVYKLIGQVSDKDHSLLEERIKRSAKNKPIIKKPVIPEPVNPLPVRAVTGIGRPNRIIPVPAALPAPVLRDGSMNSIGTTEITGLKRGLSLMSGGPYVGREEDYDNAYAHYGSYDELDKRYSYDEGSAYNYSSNRYFSVGSLPNSYPYGTRARTEVNSLQQIDYDDSECEEDSDVIRERDILPLRLQRKSDPRERARRFSRSLSYLLGEANEQEESLRIHCENLKRPPQFPLTFSRTVTSPQFTGYSQRPLSADIGNMNSRLQIDFDFIEKLIEDDVTPIERSERSNKYKLEEIPDIDSVLEYETPITLPSSRLTRPGFTSAMRANLANANVDLEDACQAINMVISQVATPDVNTVIRALSQLDEVIQSEEKSTLLIPHIDQLLIVARFQYRHVLNTKMSDEAINKEECIRIYRSLTSCLMSIFNNKELGTKASRDVLRDIIHAIICILLDSRLSTLEDGPRVVRALNVLVVRIIEKAHFVNIFSALLKLLHESVGSGENPKFTELVMKCNWKAIRILPSRSKDLNPVQILQDTHDFMVAYPSNTWVEKPNTPLRTIKTVMHTLVKVYENDILNYISQVPNSQGSELQKYIVKDLNSTQKSSSDTDDKDNNKLKLSSNDDLNTSKSPKKLSKSANTTLSEIFRKIGSKENTKEGLVELYEFKQKNPDADIDSYLKKSSQFFQNYIERGLKKVEMERQGEKMATSTSSDGSSGTAPLSSIQVHHDEAGVNVNELVDQFKAIAAQAGFDNTYIDSAVKNIYIAENNEYMKSDSMNRSD